MKGMKNKLHAFFALMIVGVIAAAALGFATRSHWNWKPLPPGDVTGIPSPATSTAATKITMELYKKSVVLGTTFEPWAVLEDSRCPIDVNCIQAGKVTVAVHIAAGSEGTISAQFQPGKTISTKTLKITLDEVLPAKTAGHKIADGEYRFAFTIAPIVAPIAPGTSGGTASAGRCYVGGCSSQLCTDKPDAVSTCEYTAAYACYQGAMCERQASGQCGWTETSSLRSCLANAGASAAASAQ